MAASRTLARTVMAPFLRQPGSPSRASPAGSRPLRRGEGITGLPGRPARGRRARPAGSHRRPAGAPGQVPVDLRRGCDLVADATGQAPRWFRPPYGLLSAGTCWAAPRLGLRTVLWTAWGRDWRADATAESVAADVRRGLRAGATVLLHDSDCTSAAGAWRSAESALPRLAELFAAHGLTVGPLGEHQVGRDP